MAKLPNAGNCPHFWTFTSSSCLKSANTHNDEAPGGRDPRNCRLFWTLISSSRLPAVPILKIQKKSPRPGKIPGPQASLFCLVRKDVTSPSLCILKIEEGSQISKPPPGPQASLPGKSSKGPRSSSPSVLWFSWRVTCLCCPFFLVSLHFFAYVIGLSV